MTGDLLFLATAVDPISTIGQWGAAGALAALMLMAGRYVYRRESDRADRLENELREVNKALVEKYVPTLDATAKALLDANQLIIELRAERRILRNDHA